jgi:hypothetical protein
MMSKILVLLAWLALSVDFWVVGVLVGYATIRPIFRTMRGLCVPGEAKQGGIGI